MNNKAHPLHSVCPVKLLQSMRHFNDVDYRDVMAAALTKRRTTNSHYSMTAFARDLYMAAPPLSRVLAKKQHLSLISARVVAEKVFIQEIDKRHFMLLVEYATAKRVEIQKILLEKIYSLREWPLDSG